MQNQVNPQYLQNMGGQYYKQTAAAAPTASAVNIQIFNPVAQAAPQGFYQANPCGIYPYNYNNAFIPQSAQYTTPSPSQYQGAPTPSMYQTMNLNGSQNGIAAQGEGEKKAENKKDDKKEKPKVILTDDYIRTLENYLNSGDKKIRLMGAKELFDRFKEDENRKDDAALTALLNKSLQDPADTVKFMALTALDMGYATGNDETVQILTDMQSTDTSYGEDAALASQVLLKISGYKSNAEAAKLSAQNNNANNNFSNGTAQNFSQPQPQVQNRYQTALNQNSYVQQPIANNEVNSMPNTQTFNQPDIKNQEGQTRIENV